MAQPRFERVCIKTDAVDVKQKNPNNEREMRNVYLACNTRPPSCLTKERDNAVVTSPEQSGFRHPKHEQRVRLPQQGQHKNIAAYPVKVMLTATILNMDISDNEI